MNEEDVLTSSDTGEGELIFVPVDTSEAGTAFDNTPVPDGEYSMLVQKVNLAVNKDGKNPYIKLLLKHTGENEKKGGVFTNLQLTGKGAFKYKAFLTALGFSEEDQRTAQVGSRIAPTVNNSKKGVPATVIITGYPVDLIGRPVNVRLVTKKQDNFAPSNDVAAFLPSA